MARPRSAAAVVCNVGIHQAVERAPVRSDIAGRSAQPSRQLGTLLVYGNGSNWCSVGDVAVLTSPAIFASVGALRAALLAAEVRARSRRILRTVGAGTRIKVVAAAHLCVGDGARSPVVPTQQTLIRWHPLVGVILSWCSVAGALPGTNGVCHTILISEGPLPGAKIVLVHLSHRSWGGRSH